MILYFKKVLKIGMRQEDKKMAKELNQQLEPLFSHKQNEDFTARKSKQVRVMQLQKQKR
jgi:hypothetical protein